MRRSFREAPRPLPREEGRCFQVLRSASPHALLMGMCGFHQQLLAEGLVAVEGLGRGDADTSDVRACARVVQSESS